MTQDVFGKLLEIGIALSSERDGDKLLEQILRGAMDITGCDAGTLYTTGECELHFRVMITKSIGISRGGSNGPIDLPPVPMTHDNVCAYSVLEQKLINIEDVYKSDLFDFSGPQKYDKLTGYKTKSMLVVPMRDKDGKTIGVMQLINAIDEQGQIVPFAKSSENILLSLSSQVAISLSNMNYITEIRRLMDSFVETFSTAIYSRTPYNVTHTDNMVRYATAFIDWLNEQEDIDWSFSSHKRRIFIMSVWLHDVGKLVTPLEVMNKETRLSKHYHEVLTRLDIIAMLAQIEQLKHGKDNTQLIEQAKSARALVQQANSAGFVSDQMIADLTKLANRTFIDQHGQSQNWLKEEELVHLSIRRGTLTEAERKIMQDHVIVTRDILGKINFGESYAMIPVWAGQHHELINGTGYPLGLSGAQLSKESRLLTILDIFDGLSATDRPYKPAIPIDRVFLILDEMRAEGAIDGEILDMFKRSKAWNTQNSEKKVEVTV